MAAVIAHRWTLLAVLPFTLVALAQGAGVSGDPGSFVGSPHVASSAAIDPPAAVGWEALGAGLNETVWALVVDATGALYAGGGFTQAGGEPVGRVARWEGGAWHPLGAGLNNTVWTLALGPDGSLYAGGSFTQAGGAPANRVARWDGEAWHPLGSGMDNIVSTLVVGQDGSVYAGGWFTEAEGRPASYVARWDGEAWHPLGEGVGGFVLALALGPNGSVYTGGFFTEAGGAPASRVARWDGEAWHPLAGGVDDAVRALLVDTDGSLYVGGDFFWANNAAGRVSARSLARWDGTEWRPIGGANDIVRSLVMDSQGALYAGGRFRLVGGQEASRVAWRDETSWHPLGAGVNDEVQALALAPDGSLYLGGRFTEAGGEAASHIARVTGLPSSATDGATPLRGLALEVPYPNPARAAVTLAFAIAEAGPVRLALYDLLGREVAVPLYAPLGAGPHEVTVRTSGLVAGVYVVRLEAGGTVTSRRITVVR